MFDQGENEMDVQKLNGLSLAFLGDAIFEILVREHLLKNGSLPIGELHSLAVKYVRASAQAHFFDVLEPLLSEEELSALHRGRNANSNHIPKSACAVEYRKATGTEALFGWLYLERKNERMRELFAILLDHLPTETEETL